MTHLAIPLHVSRMRFERLGTNAFQSIKIGTQIEIGNGKQLCEGLVANGLGSADVDRYKGASLERPCANGFKTVRQNDIMDEYSTLIEVHERLVANGLQGRRELNDGHSIASLERRLANGFKTFRQSDGMAAAILQRMIADMLDAFRNLDVGSPAIVGEQRLTILADHVYAGLRPAFRDIRVHGERNALAGVHAVIPRIEHRHIRQFVIAVLSPRLLDIGDVQRHMPGMLPVLVHRGFDIRNDPIEELVVGRIMQFPGRQP